MAAFGRLVMLVVTCAAFIVVFGLYRLADHFATAAVSRGACRSCPHWDLCLSRRLCRVEPSKDPELCIQLWN